ncbi:hypothetical protein [Zophobihabitans entericus]|uniref:Uncharacterized protein n=1 Tax=Zophobihabitans entericus TaxID=1635327 RepID=A0A6G9I9J7_9GAMM|nr:hypothetical protein [Zophobihabitans entericus]QIQ20908.1 hypothetical protein IPMB12_03945 [Zophobihabitans entericus]
MIQKSFFKLSVIFALAYYVLTMVTSIVVAEADYNFNMLLVYVGNGAIYSISQLFFYFFVVTIICYRNKIYKVVGKNVAMVLIIALMAVILQTVLGYAWFTIMVSLYDYDMFDILWVYIAIQIIYDVMNIALVTIFIIFLFQLFKPMAEHEEQFEFNTTNVSRIYSVLFTSLLIAIFTFFAVYALSDYITLWYYNDEVTVITVMLSLVIGIFINIFFIYFSVRRCFTQIYATLQVAKIIKSVVITILILIGVSILFGVVMGALGMMLLSDSDWGALIIFMLVTMVLAVIVNYVSLFLSSRFAVRRYFSSKITTNE